MVAIKVPIDPEDPPEGEIPLGEYIYSVILIGLAMYFQYIREMLNDMGGTVSFVEDIGQDLDFFEDDEGEEN